MRPADGDEGGVDRTYRLPILLSLFGLVLVLVFYLGVRSGSPLSSVWYYWVGLVLTLVPGLMSKNRLATGLSVGIFVFLQCFSYALSAPYGIVYSTDPIYNLQAVNLIASNHFWSADVGSGQTLLYTFYPGSTFYQTALAFTTGLPLDVAFMFATSILRFAAMPLAIFKILRRFISDRPSFIAVAMLFAAPSYIVNLPVLQEFAIIFVALSLHAIFTAPWSSSKFVMAPGALVAAFLFLSTVAVSHYFTAYIFAFLLAALALASIFRRSDRAARVLAGARSSGARALMGFRYAAPVYAYVFILWFVYVSRSVDVGWFQYGQEALATALSPGGLERPGGVSASGVRPGFTYSTLELGLIAAAVVLWFIAAFLGALLMSRRAFRRGRRREPATRVILALFVASMVLVLVTVPLVFTRGFFIPLRVMEFAGFGLAPLAGLFLAFLIGRTSYTRKALVAVTISVLVVGGSLVAIAGPRFYYIPRTVQYCEMPTHETPDAVAAAMWAKDHIPANTTVWGDELSYNIFGGYGQFHLGPMSFGGFLLFNSTTLNATDGHEFGLRPGAFIVVDIYMTKSLCFASFRDTPFPSSAIDKFHGNPLVTEVFQNAAFTIYRWEGPA